MKIGFISDAHGNGPSVEKAHSLMSSRGVSRFYFLGDSIGYIPSLSALEALTNKKYNFQCIRGNHEQMILNGNLNKEKENIYLHNNLPEKFADYIHIIKKWPKKLVLTLQGISILMLHGSPSNPIYGYIYPNTDLLNEKCSFDWVFMGNTHFPFISSANNINYVNVGSCGMPRDDGRFGSAAILDLENNKCEIIRFDIQRETGILIKKFTEVHISVLDTYQRRSRSLTGRIVRR